MGSKYPGCYHPYNLGILILRSATLFSSRSFTGSNLSPLVTWLVAASGNFITAGNINSATWGTNMTTASLVMSMSVNALVTGLIVFRIFKVFREVKANTTLDEKSLGVAGGRTIRRVMFVMIESGMALFSIQLARVMSTALRTSVSTNGLLDVYNYTVNFHEMLNVIKNNIHFIVNFFTENMDLARV